MKSAMQTNVRAAGGDTDVATVEIGLERRHDALALMAALIQFHSFVVQHDRAHWVVHARVPGCHDETLDDLLATIERWVSDFGLNDFTCVLGEQVVELTHPSEFGGDEERS